MLKFVANSRTICEVLREINDEMQGEQKHPIVLEKLREAEKMAKKMMGKLVEYNKDIKKGWWKENKDYAEKLEKRMKESYLV